MIVGSAVGAVIEWAAVEASSKMLSDRQQERSATALVLAGVAIDRKLGLGYEPRSDDFFLGEPGRQSIAQELLEGVVLAAQDSFEERKLPYLASMFVNFIFRGDVGRVEANYLISVASALTYTQLCILAVAASGEGFPERSRQLGTPPNPSAAAFAMRLELLRLLEAHLIYTNYKGGGRDLDTYVPSAGAGLLLYELMELQAIPEIDRIPVIERLRE